MIRFLRPALLAAGAAMLAACSMFDHSSPPAPAPQSQQAAPYSQDDQQRHGLIGPAPTAQNRE